MILFDVHFVTYSTNKKTCDLSKTLFVKETLKDHLQETLKSWK
jgi:hypothetical protein